LPPTIQRIAGSWRQALGVVHILVSGKATKYRLPEQPGQCVPTILATACVGLKSVSGKNGLISVIFMDFAVQWSHVPPIV
jgi:hypothetical protein